MAADFEARVLTGGVAGLDLTEYLRPILKPLAAHGMWSTSIYDESVCKNVAVAAGLLLLVLFLVQLVTELLGGPLLLAASGDLDRFIHDMSFIALHLDSLWKWVFMLVRRGRVVRLLNNLQCCLHVGVLACPADRLTLHNNFLQDHKITGEPLELCGLLKMSRRRSFLATCTWIGFCISGATHWYFAPLLKGDFSLRMDAWYPFDAQQAPIKQVVYCLQFVAGISALVLLCLFDCFLLWLQQLLCLQLRYLAANLRNLASLGGGLCPEREQMLGACVTHHVHILSCMREINSNLSPLLFLQCFKNMVLLCVVAFLASMAGLDDPLELLSLGLFFTAACSQLFCYCWGCEQLTHLAIAVGDAAYNSGWENWGISSQKSITTIVCRSQRTFVFKGGAFYTLCMETFVDLLKLSFSYYTVLRNIRDVDEHQL